MLVKEFHQVVQVLPLTPVRTPCRVTMCALCTSLKQWLASFYRCVAPSTSSQCRWTARRQKPRSGTAQRRRYPLLDSSIMYGKNSRQASPARRRAGLTAVCG